jgi:hypothetical protein
MSIRLVLGLTCLVVLSQISQSQSTEQDDIQASTKSCRLVQMTLATRERHREAPSCLESRPSVRQQTIYRLVGPALVAFAGWE